MSTTTTTAPSPAIIAAQTPADVARAALADPALNAALMQLLTAPDAKGLLQSKTFWAAILTPIVSGAVSYFALKLDPATIGTITTLLEVGAMVAMRVVTKAPVSGLMGPAPVAAA